HWVLRQYAGRNCVRHQCSRRLFPESSDVGGPARAIGRDGRFISVRSLGTGEELARPARTREAIEDEPARWARLSVCRPPHVRYLLSDPDRRGPGLCAEPAGESHLDLLAQLHRCRHGTRDGHPRDAGADVRHSLLGGEGMKSWNRWVACRSSSSATPIPVLFPGTAWHINQPHGGRLVTNLWRIPCNGRTAGLRVQFRVTADLRGRFSLAALTHCLSDSRPSPASTPNLEVLVIPCAVALRHQRKVLCCIPQRNILIERLCDVTSRG